MKALFIGGTGAISTAVAALAMDKGWEVILLNRGSGPVPEGMESMVVDIHDKATVACTMGGRTYDVMTQFTVYGTEDVQRDIWPLQEKTRQYIFISSASTYQKPTADCPITESTPLINLYWEYSRKKIGAEEVLAAAYRKDEFPVAVVHPSHTYDGKKPPITIHGHKGNWQILRRILEGEPTTMPGGGTFLWTLIHSADFARGHVGLMGNPHAIGNACHITSDESMTWNQTYGTLIEILDRLLSALHVASDFLVEHGKKYDLTDQLLGDKTCTVLLDNTKIKRAVLDFVCTISVAEGTRNSVRYMMDYLESQTLDPQFDARCDRIAGAWKAADEAFGE